MTVTVKNRDLGEITVLQVAQSESGETRVVFRSEAGELIASHSSDGALIITDPAYPKLRYNAERFRPLLMEALQKWQAASSE